MALARLAHGLDGVVRRQVLTPRRASRADALGHAERIEALQGIRDFYDAQMPDVFAPVPRIAPRQRRRRSFGSDGEVVDLSWASTFESLWPDPVRSVYAKSETNRGAHARWFRHRDGPRPAIVLLHGYLGGNFAFEERVWPSRWLFSLGFDLVLSCMPRHGPRRAWTRRGRGPGFPSSDPRFTIEGLRQMVMDHQALLGWLLDGRASSVGVSGMSLGGYATALLATVDARWSFAAPIIPLASIPMFADRNRRLVGAIHEQREQRELLEAAYRSVSPLQRSLRMDASRMMIAAGEADRITGMDHARALGDHFDAPVVSFPGGHIMQLGRRGAFRELQKLWRRLHLID